MDAPCPTCPWRLTSDPSGKDIPGFDFDKMLGLEATVPEQDTFSAPHGPPDGFYTIMACHHSEQGADTACRGYLARHGDINLNVRLYANKIGFNSSDARRLCDEIPMYATYFDMRDAMADSLADEWSSDGQA